MTPSGAPSTPLPAVLAHAQAALAATWPGMTLEVAQSLASTNAALLERARAGDAAPCLLMAREQTAGRGRQGRPWQSREGDSLTFSLALPLAPADWSGLSLAVGLAIVDALEPTDAADARLGLKWPNDVVLRGPASGEPPWRKLGGILIETVAGPSGRVAVIGVGLNLAAPQHVAADYAVAGLREILPEADVDGTLARVAPPLARALQRFERDGLAPWRAAWRRRDVLAGMAVRTSLPGEPGGTADGIDATGALRLIDPARPDAPPRLVGAGEVSVRPRAAVPGVGA